MCAFFFVTVLQNNSASIFSCGWGQHGVNLIVDSVVFFSFNGGFICSHQSRFFHQQTPQKNLIFVREKKGSSKKWPDSIHLSGGTFHKSFAFQIFFKVHSAVEKAKNSIFFKVQEKGFFFADNYFFFKCSTWCVMCDFSFFLTLNFVQPLEGLSTQVKLVIIRREFLTIFLIHLFFVNNQKKLRKGCVTNFYGKREEWYYGFIGRKLARVIQEWFCSVVIFFILDGSFFFSQKLLCTLKGFC